jgi:hypothetical protein
VKDKKAISELKREGVIEVVIDVDRQQKEKKHLTNQTKSKFFRVYPNCISWLSS